MEIEAHQLLKLYTTKEHQYIEAQKVNLKRLFADNQVAKREAKEQNRLYSKDFNPLDYFQFSETTHSRLLADLLSPNGMHGQDELFLGLFLKKLDMQMPVGGIWQVRPEKENVDVLLLRKKFNNVILIENKSNDAKDQLNQLYRYWYANIFINNRKLFPADNFPEELPSNFRIVYIVSSENKKPLAHSLEKPDDLKDPSAPARLPESWVTIWNFKNQVVEMIAEALALIPGNIRLAVYLQLYIEKINSIKVMNNKTAIHLSLKTFDEPAKWDAFLDLKDTQESIEHYWVVVARNKLRESFSSTDTWEIEFGGYWWDMRWHFHSEIPIPINFWLCSNGNFHFVVPNDGTKSAIIQQIFDKPLYDPLRYVWGTDVETNQNAEIKLRLLGKWAFNSPYDGDMNYSRLVWYAGNETDSFVEQVKERVSKFQHPAIVELLKRFQMELVQALQ